MTGAIIKKIVYPITFQKYDKGNISTTFIDHKLTEHLLEINNQLDKVFRFEKYTEYSDLFECYIDKGVKLTHLDKVITGCFDIQVRGGQLVCVFTYYLSSALNGQQKAQLLKNVDYMHFKAGGNDLATIVLDGVTYYMWLLPRKQELSRKERVIQKVVKPPKDAVLDKSFKVCANKECGKTFKAVISRDWAYKIGSTYYCRYNCYRLAAAPVKRKKKL